MQWHFLIRNSNGFAEWPFFRRFLDELYELTGVGRFVNFEENSYDITVIVVFSLQTFLFVEVQNRPFPFVHNHDRSAFKCRHRESVKLHKSHWVEENATNFFLFLVCCHLNDYIVLHNTVHWRAPFRIRHALKGNELWPILPNIAVSSFVRVHISTQSDIGFGDLCSEIYQNWLTFLNIAPRFYWLSRVFHVERYLENLTYLFSCANIGV